MVIERQACNRRASCAASAGAHPESLRAQGIRTRNTIIRVARERLLESGTLDFSQRAVAQRAGISVSNLQYYFPTRLALLRAVMEPEIETYLNELTLALKSTVPPRQLLDNVLDRVLRDVRDHRRTTLWLHFVSFASIHADCGQLLEAWYDALTQAIAELVRAVNPGFTATDSEHVASLLIALADGLALQYSMGRRQHGHDVGARFMEAAHELVEGRAHGSERC